MPMISICIYMHNEILFSHKNKEILPFATTWMNLEYYAKWSIKQNWHILYDSIYMLALKNKWTNKTHTCREQIGGCLKGGWLRGG